MNCILFLDFDGVMHPESCRKPSFFCQLPLIEEVLRAQPQVEVVISSTWRYDHTLPELRAFFSPDIRSLIIGVTPSVAPTDHEGWIPTHLLQHHREWECRKWLRQHRPVDTPWLAVDDVSEWFLPDCENLLVTCSELGFQPAQASILHVMLEARTGAVLRLTELVRIEPDGASALGNGTFK